MRRHPAWIFLLLTVTGLASLAQPVAAATSTKVPVVACPTTRGITGHPPARYPKELAPDTPIRNTKAVAYYSDSARNLTPVLGPRGWKCAVEIGADGTTGVVIHPRGTPTTGKTAVTVQSSPACQGCVWGLVCDLIPGAAKQVGAGQPACPSTRPEREHVHWIKGSPHTTGKTRDVVRFVDPPNVKGDGNPSGGRDPAYGVLLYNWTKKAGGSASLETCTLPKATQRTCTEALADFTNRNWGMPQGRG